MNDECRVLRPRIPIDDAIFRQLIFAGRNFPAHLADERHRRRVLSGGLNASYFYLSRDTRGTVIATPKRNGLEDSLLGRNHPRRCTVVVARHEHRHVARRSSLRFRCMRRKPGDARQIDSRRTASAGAWGSYRCFRRLMSGLAGLSVARRTGDQEVRNGDHAQAHEALRARAHGRISVRVAPRTARKRRFSRRGGRGWCKRRPCGHSSGSPTPQTCSQRPGGRGRSLPCHSRGNRTPPNPPSDCTVCLGALLPDAPCSRLVLRAEVDAADAVVGDDVAPGVPSDDLDVERAPAVLRVARVGAGWLAQVVTDGAKDP